MLLICRVLMSFLVVLLVACDESSTAQAETADQRSVHQTKADRASPVESEDSAVLSESERLEKSFSDIEGRM
ncbi:MAG: hypothetical protein WBN41_00780, partial [Lysobacterales bacterium]